MAGGNAEKGHRYSVALDQARAQGKWEEVPELIRKVTKHSPQRICIIQTATAESRVIAYQQQKTTEESSSTPNLHELIPALLTTIENNDGSQQEILQASVCLGWIHWTLNEPALAASRLPKDFRALVDSILHEDHELSAWTEVCLVKGCYIKGIHARGMSTTNMIGLLYNAGSAQSAVTDIDETLETFSSLLAWLSSGKLTTNANSQFLSWAETLLGKGALLASEEAITAGQNANPRHVEIALRLFRLWALHPSVKQSLASNTSQPSTPGPSRSTVWRAYYGLLTTILQEQLDYTPQLEGPERPQLASEIRLVESICESNLLREVKFPTANAGNSPVEAWVEQVIGNWQILCGPYWHDQDLGEGGQNAVGRNVLDILYRAATKTYHSHLILRRLFHVHAALSEFDLAIKALDSYIEIVTSAKERAAKSANYGELESDDTLLQTLSEGVTLLSCLGSFEEAEKAKDMTDMMQTYIDQKASTKLDTENLALNYNANSNAPSEISPSVLAQAYRAIGVGLANWATYTPLNEARDEIRAEAIDYLERSVAPELGNESNFSSLYALSLTLAQNRDLDAAMDCVKSALSSHDPSSASDDLSKERDLVSLWHLLALLLSAKQEFDIAERSCEAAFEQFPSEIFPKSSRERRASRQSHNGPATLKRTILGRLQNREKERILEIRMTQLAFVEVLEGPEAAVNKTEQLLSLFGILFQDLNLETEGNRNSKCKEHLVPPKSSAGTAKSFRSSLFSRNRASQLPDRRAPSVNSETPPVPAVPSGGGDAPSIQVTDDDHERHPRTAGSDSKKADTRSSSTPRPERSPIRSPVSNGSDSPALVGIAVSGNTSPVSERRPASGRQPLPPIPHNMSHLQQPYPGRHEHQPPVQDVRLPSGHRYDSPTIAVTKFTTIQSKKHALALLVKIWLVIAGLYRRASLFDDAREACEEALKQASRMEALTSAEDSSARNFTKRGWTAAKSSEELWADVYAEQGLLAQAHSNPHEAMKLFEDALLRDPEHPTATIGLANLLLDIWDQTLVMDSANADVDCNRTRQSLLSDTAKLTSARAVSIDQLKAPEATKVPGPVSVSNSPHEADPKYLHRLAARDRAYALLSSLTKLGSSWDNSEAWYALSRAYEAGEQVEKLKEVLWWCIELEDRRPIRHWSNIGSGLYVL
ncbi:Tetratricopeptide-like helical [Penicillium chermesinum]|uniref:Tetratricopeptide-like helical n=1 Tax=Penicillium chermesinum TaxID=63820 RepID=A0A9W9NS28_9EURO|nr:Tetratricopeptide-like helical [Penicillium chermesinum]KAJ5223584.1 Tetratricopeptide-like helical [Penicillium chermesinum]